MLRAGKQAEVSSLKAEDYLVGLRSDFLRRFDRSPTPEADATRRFVVEFSAVVRAFVQTEALTSSEGEILMSETLARLPKESRKQFNRASIRLFGGTPGIGRGARPRGSQPPDHLLARQEPVRVIPLMHRLSRTSIEATVIVMSLEIWTNMIVIRIAETLPNEAEHNRLEAALEWGLSDDHGTHYSLEGRGWRVHQREVGTLELMFSPSPPKYVRSILIEAYEAVEQRPHQVAIDLSDGGY